jgi:hypothetical protein
MQCSMVGHILRRRIRDRRQWAVRRSRVSSARSAFRIFRMMRFLRSCAMRMRSASGEWSTARSHTSQFGSSSAVTVEESLVNTNGERRFRSLRNAEAAAKLKTNLNALPRFLRNSASRSLRLSAAAVCCLPFANRYLPRQPRSWATVRIRAKITEAAEASRAAASSREMYIPRSPAAASTTGATLIPSHRQSC